MSGPRSLSVDQPLERDCVVAPEDVVEALTAVLSSEAFSAAPRSQAFLAYVVTEHLAGRGERLGEHAVARHALGRSEYDPRLDSTVRVRATRVRTALQRYYDAEGAGATVRFSLPPGRYAPTIVRGDSRTTAPAAHDDVEVAVVDQGATGTGAGCISTRACHAIAARLARFPGLTVVGPTAAADRSRGCVTPARRPPPARGRG